MCLYYTDQGQLAIGLYFAVQLYLVLFECFCTCTKGAPRAHYARIFDLRSNAELLLEGPPWKDVL